MATSAEARKELARRELARRRGQQAALPPGGGDTSGAGPRLPPQDQTSGHVLESREPGMLESIGNWLKDAGLPIDRYKRDAQTADDAARLFANKATFNQADRLAAGLEGTTPQQQWERTAAADERAGGVGDLAQIAGAIATPLAAGKVGATLMRPGLAALPGIGGALARGGTMAVEGGLYGAAEAGGEGQDVATGALKGAGFGAGGQMVGETVGKVVSALGKGGGATKSLDDLRAAKTAAYDEVAKTGGYYKPAAFSALADDITRTAQDMNINPELHKGAGSVLSLIQKLKAGKGAPTLTDIDQLRQLVWRDAGGGSAADKEFARAFVDKIDDFIDNAPVSSMAGGGDPTKAAAAVTKARALNRQYKNAERFDEAMAKADRRAASTYSGGNLENAQRQNARQILDDPRKSKFLNKQEKEALETMVRGTPGQNRARKIGKTLHSIPGVGGLLGGGGILAAADMAGTGGALTIAALLAGAGAKGISRGMGNTNKAMVEALLREGKAPTKSGLTPKQIQMLSRLLLGGSVGAAGM